MQNKHFSFSALLIVTFSNAPYTTKVFRFLRPPMGDDGLATSSQSSSLSLSHAVKRLFQVAPSPPEAAAVSTRSIHVAPSPSDAAAAASNRVFLAALLSATVVSLLVLAAPTPRVAVNILLHAASSPPSAATAGWARWVFVTSSPPVIAAATTLLIFAADLPRPSLPAVVSHLVPAACCMVNIRRFWRVSCLWVDVENCKL